MRIDTNYIRDSINIAAATHQSIELDRNRWDNDKVTIRVNTPNGSFNFSLTLDEAKALAHGLLGTALAQHTETEIVEKIVEVQVPVADE